MNQKIKFPRSEKVYLPGTLFPELRVAMRKVEQVPSTNFIDGEKVLTPNPEVYVYDTSGPFSDADMSIDLKKGLPRMREEWIVGRGDVEQLPEITSEYGQMRREERAAPSARAVDTETRRCGAAFRNNVGVRTHAPRRPVARLSAL